MSFRFVGAGDSEKNSANVNLARDQEVAADHDNER